MFIGHGIPMQSNILLALRTLVERVENRRDKGDWQLSADDSKAVAHAREAIAEYDRALCPACFISAADGAKTVGG